MRQNSDASEKLKRETLKLRKQLTKPTQLSTLKILRTRGW